MADEFNPVTVPQVGAALGSKLRLCKCSCCTRQLAFTLQSYNELAVKPLKFTDSEVVAVASTDPCAG